ncbi:hypothetical protein D0962_23380 [Leptolyngbyaceae cyanobacterium CCMR0082]|uniref:Uncharacterized protein n=2 Tax=Adonisia TaxID=2950183 RepID=A0A6M0SDA9_9CYAN|nr:hypothetical protein [Adonisia turfae CCMR0082]
MINWAICAPLDLSLRKGLDTPEDKLLLYDPERGYAPNPGGQTRFWQEAFGGFSADNYNQPSYRSMSLIGGIGSGKSYTGAVWACDRAIKYPKARGVITANSFSQLSQATLTTLAEVCMQYNIPLDPIRDTPEETALAIANRRPAHCLLGPDRAYVYVLTAAAFEGKKQTNRGLQARWAWFDECAYSTEQAYNTLNGRIGRGPGKPMTGQLCLTTTPRGFNWLYYRLADPSRKKSWKKTFWFTNCPTWENQENLGDDYVESLQGDFDGDEGRQELGGEFLNTNIGLIFKYFNRNKHGLTGKDAKILRHRPDERLHINLDFNATPCVAVLFQTRRDECHAFKEFYVLDSDIYELSEKIRDWLIEHKQTQEIWLHGDASGRNRSATSKLSAWDIVWNTLSETGLDLKRKFPKANPPIANRIDSFNWLCRQNKFFIDLDNCPETTKDIETMTYAGEEMDKSDILRSHCIDALSYGTHWCWPYGGRNRVPKKKRQVLPGIDVAA